MAVVIFIVIAVIVICFAGVLLFGAPYLPTLSPQVAAALELADMQPGQTMLELGCGDGKVLIAAAKAGYQAVGYELNPILAAIAWLRTRRFRGQVTVICGNFWNRDWPVAEVIFTFLLPKYMTKLHTNIIQYIGSDNKLVIKSVKLVSFAFVVPDKQPSKELQGVYLYEY